MHSDKWGPLLGIFAAACCLGAAPVLAALSAAGLGFVVDDRLLVPFLVVALGATLWRLARDRRRHARSGPERLAWAAALPTLAGLSTVPVATAVGLALLVTASTWNWILVRRLCSGADAVTSDCPPARSPVAVRSGGAARHDETMSKSVQPRKMA